MNRINISFPITPPVHLNNGLVIERQLDPGKYRTSFVARDAQGNSFVLKFPNLTNVDASLIEYHIKKINLANAVEYSNQQLIHHIPGIPFQHQLIQTNLLLTVQGVQTISPYSLPQTDFVDGPNLLAWSKAWAERHDPRYSAVTGFRGVGNKLWFEYAHQLLSLIEAIHLQGVVHCDIHPRNILCKCEAGALECPRFHLIDFGSSSGIEYPGIAPKQGYVAYIYRAPETIRADIPQRGQASNPPRWYAPRDIFSIGMVLLYLAIGDVLEDLERTKFRGVYRLVQSDTGDYEGVRKGGLLSVGAITPREDEEIKDNITELVQEYNKALLRHGGAVVDIIMSCIRPLLEGRSKTATEVIRSMRHFANGEKIYRSDIVKSMRDKVAVIDDSVTEFAAKSTNPILLAILNDRIQDVINDLNSASSNYIATWRGRRGAINDLLTTMSHLGPGDSCIALTTFQFWRKDAGGPNGRLLTMLKHMALRGVSISWLLVERKNPMYDDKNDLTADAQILHYQIKTMQEMDSLLSGEERQDRSGALAVRVCTLEADEYRRVISDRETFICLSYHNVETLCIPDYSSERGGLSTIRFWNDAKMTSAHKLRYNHYLQTKICKLVSDIEMD